MSETIELTVIDDSDHVGWMASFTRSGELYMKDVKSMVSAITTHMKSQADSKISRLNILDHGNKQGIEIGKDYIHSGNLKNYVGDLIKLRPYFSVSGFIHLQHCDIGKNQLFLSAFSLIVNVPVYAGTGKHNPVYRFNFGR